MCLMSDRPVDDADVVHDVSFSPAGASSRAMASSQTSPVTVSITRPSTHQPTFV